MYITQHTALPSELESAVDIITDWPELLLEITFEGDNPPLVSYRMPLSLTKKYRAYSSQGLDQWNKDHVHEYFKPSPRSWVASWCKLVLSEGGDEVKTRPVYLSPRLSTGATDQIKLLVLIPREAWQDFDLTQGQYLYIYQLKLSLTSETYNDLTPPWDNFLGSPALHIKTPSIWLKLHQPSQKTRLAIDIGSFGNVISHISTSGRSKPLVDTPLNLHEVISKLSVQAGGTEVIKDSIKHYWATDSKDSPPQLPSLFLRSEMVDPISQIMIGAQYEERLFNQADSALIKHTRWSAKSYINTDEFLDWSKAVYRGLNRRISLPEGLKRQGLSRDPVISAKSDQSLPSKPSSIYLSYPSTWMSSQRNALRNQIAEAFELKKTEVNLIADEATAGAFGWLANLIGKDSDPSTTLALLSEETLFTNVNEAQTIQEQRQQMSKSLKPMHVLVIDAGAGTTDISVLNYEYNEETHQIESETIARQGFIAGGHELSRSLSALWKDKIGEQLQELDYSEGLIARTLCTLVSESEIRKESEAEIDRRKQLMIKLYQLAEYEKRRATDEEYGDDPDELYGQLIKLINIDANIDDDLLKSALSLSEDELSRVCAEVLGSALIGAVDLPIQHGITKLDQIFLLGRTLRLPKVVDAFLEAMRDKVNILRETKGGDWSELIPSPNQIFAWSRTQEMCALIGEECRLPNEIDKNSVVEGLNVIATARIKGVQSMSFKHYDRNYRQRFIGVGRMQSWYWKYDLVGGALPGQKPDEFIPFDEDYTLEIMGEGAEEVELMWNNLGRSKGTKLKLGSMTYELPPERGYLLGKISLEKTDQYEVTSMTMIFTLIEDGRVALKSIELMTDQDKQYRGVLTDLKEPKRSALLENRIIQSIKVGQTEVRYEESYQHVDYRDHGYISESYDSE